jgi:hypothetical protein
MLNSKYWVSEPVEQWAGCAVDYPNPTSAEVKGKLELYTYSPSGLFVVCYICELLTFYLPFIKLTFYYRFQYSPYGSVG